MINDDVTMIVTMITISDRQ